MTKAGIILMTLILLCGCAKIRHMQELLTLKSYSDNQEIQDKHIAKQNANFDKLLAAVEEDTVKEYKTKKEFLREFGEPILIKKIGEGGDVQQEWLYRYAMEYFNTDKVYVYFDEEGRLVNWLYVAAPKKENTDVPDPS